MLTITGLYASLLALMFIFLGFRVVMLRRKLKIGLLDGDNSQLLKAMRVHGNASEWIPITMILFACAESQQMIPWALHALGCLFLFARGIHAYGLNRSKGLTFGRKYGMLGTWLVILVLVCFNAMRFSKTLI